MVDLLDSLADREGFRYQLRLSADNMYVVRVPLRLRLTICKW